MALAQILLQLWRLRLWVVIGTLLAVAAAVASLSMSRSTVYSSASTQMLVDSPHSSLADAQTDLTGYVARATVFARLMTSPEALQYIGRAAGIPGNLIAATGPVEVNGSPNTASSPTTVRRGRVVSVSSHYKLDFLQNPALPTVDVYGEAPTTKRAIALVNGAVAGFASYINQLGATGAIPSTRRIVIRQLGPATGGVVDPGASKKIALLIFVGVLVVWCALVLFVRNLIRNLRTARLQHAAPNGALSQGARAHELAATRYHLPLLDDVAGLPGGDAPAENFERETDSSAEQDADDGTQEDDVSYGVRLGQ